MKEEIKNKLLAKYQDGSLNLDEQLLLEQAIEQGAIDLSELDNDVLITEVLDEVNNRSWNEDMDHAYYRHLQNVYLKKPFPIKLWTYLSYGVAACVILLIGFWMNRPVNVVGTPAVAKEQNWVQVINETEKVHDKIDLIARLEPSSENADLLKTLLFILKTDESTHVRIASLEALSEYTDEPFVRKGLIEAIKYQISPVVISNLIVLLQEGDDEVDYKKEINESLPIQLRNSIDESLIKI